MKLSDKGLLKILDDCYFDDDYDEYVLRSINRKQNLFEIQNITFEPNDFQDCAILTLEEAQVILDAFFVLEQESELTQEEMKVVDKLQKIVINECTKRMELKNG